MKIDGLGGFERFLQGDKAQGKQATRRGQAAERLGIRRTRSADELQGKPGARRGQATGGVVSPSTINALERFEARLARITGENRGEIDELTGQLRERLAELAGADDRPFGQSVEHQFKQLLIHAFRLLAGEPKNSEPVEPEPSIGLPEQPGEGITAEGATGSGSDATAIVALDRSV